MLTLRLLLVVRRSRLSSRWPRGFWRWSLVASLRVVPK
jgi:hypothetical protein